MNFEIVHSEKFSPGLIQSCFPDGPLSLAGVKAQLNSGLDQKTTKTDSLENEGVGCR